MHFLIYILTIFPSLEPLTLSQFLVTLLHVPGITQDRLEGFHYPIPHTEQCYLYSLVKSMLLFQHFLNHTQQFSHHLSSHLNLSQPLFPISSSHLFFMFLVVMIHWTDQMKELLNDQKILKKSNTCGPLQEIAFWRSRSAKSLDISKQLQKPEVRHIQNILQLSKSIYVQRFSKLAEELQVKII